MAEPITTAPAADAAEDPAADLAGLLWPRARIGEAVALLLAAAGDGRRVGAASPLPTPLPPPDDDALDAWLVRAGRAARCDIEAVTVSFGEAAAFLRHAGPALIRLPGTGPGAAGGFLLLMKGGSRRLRCVALDGAVADVPAGTVQAALTAPLTARHRTRIDGLLDAAGIPAARRPAAEAALLGELLGGRSVPCGWLVRPAADAPLALQMREAGIRRTVAVALGAEAAVQGLLVASWLTIGGEVLGGHLRTAWLDAWALLLLSTIPFQFLAYWAEGVLAVRLGVLLKRRLLAGILRLTPEDVRTRGAGQFMTMAMEADVLELVSLAGGLLALMAGLRLAAAVTVLALGAGGVVAAALLLKWLGLAAWLVHRLWRQAQDWAASYRLLTNDMIERMVGHRTRLAQERPERWHEEEDALLETYWRHGRRLDRLSWLLQGGLARGWMAVGLAGLFAALAFGSPDVATFGLCLLGVLLAYQAFLILGEAAPSLIQLAVAWREIGPLFAAADRPADAAQTAAAPPPTAADPARPVLSAGSLAFAYRPGGRLVLDGCDLDIQPGARLLLEGSSGGGKSTLAAVLAGLRRPTGGYLLLNGAERAAVADRDWRRAVLTVPQFHENHVFTGTFAFNLLMGRGWPPQPGDLEAAREICLELGLGPLLERMPAGFQQMVGESGWLLSHGERSRLFIARALLQNAEVVILDESFAALDPENLERALGCVLARAPALLVIAHP